MESVILLAGKNYFLYPLPSAPAGRDIMEQKTGGVYVFA